MIYFKTFENHGRLGNQLFQLGLCLYLAVKNNKQVSLKKPWNYKDYFELNKKYNNILCYGATDKIKFNYEEPFFNFTKINFVDDINLSGYFQSELYFSDEEINIADLFFNPKIDLLNNLIKKYEIRNTYNVSIHIRRGDYVKYSNYFCDLTKSDYYKNCISQVLYNNNNVKFFVFSDDIEYSKNFIKSITKYDNIIFVAEAQDILEMFLMSLCNDNIIANSTFSWWGAYLNKNTNKRIFYPTEWFGPDYKEYNTKDLIPKSWNNKKYINIFDA